MNELITVDKAGQLYIRMRNAITECHSVDDCRSIANQAHAIAAYFHQIKDDSSVRKFLAVKLRAWRRVGEILRAIDYSDCGTVVSYARKARAGFPDNAALKEMADSAIVSALNLSKLPEDFFEREVGRQSSVSGMLNTYARLLNEERMASPEYKAEMKKQEAEWAKQKAKKAEQEAERMQKLAEGQAILDARAVEQEKERKRQQRDLETLEAARQIAMSDVGFTMDRRDRENMKEVVFLIKSSIHKMLRQAAFDEHMTMQAVLRAGLFMWFIANGYPVSMDDMGVKPKPTSPPRGRPPKSPGDMRPTA